MIGSAIISGQTGHDDDFPIPRKDYMKALLTGDAALMKHLTINGEIDTLKLNYSSCSDTEEIHITPINRAVDTDPPKPTLPLFPMIQTDQSHTLTKY